MLIVVFHRLKQSCVTHGIEAHALRLRFRDSKIRLQLLLFPPVHALDVRRCGIARYAAWL